MKASLVPSLSQLMSDPSHTPCCSLTKQGHWQNLGPPVAGRCTSKDNQSTVLGRWQTPHPLPLIGSCDSGPETGIACCNLIRGAMLGPNTRTERDVRCAFILGKAHGLVRGMVKVTGECCDGSTALGSWNVGDSWKRELKCAGQAFPSLTPWRTCPEQSRPILGQAQEQWLC